MSRSAVGLVLAAALVGAQACEKAEFEPPDREERVREAARSYRAARFDTLTWASDSARIQDGNGVYAAECRRCHGTLGRGDTELARERNLDVPSLVEPDQGWAASIDSARARIYTGHPAGMPTFGVARLSEREIDGVAHYLLERLRPEVLEEGSGG